VSIYASEEKPDAVLASRPRLRILWRLSWNTVIGSFEHGIAHLTYMTYSDSKVGKIKSLLSQFISQNTTPRPNATGRLHEAPSLDGSNLAGPALRVHLPRS